MPTFNLKVKFNNQGTTDATQKFNGVAAAAGKAQKSTDGLVKSVSKFASTAQVQKLADQFEAVGISINTAGKQVQNLAARMQRVSRENLFQQLGNDAKLSALQMARLRAGMGDIRGAFTSLSSVVTSSKLAIVAWGAAMLYVGKSILDAQIELQRLEQSYKSVFGESAAAQLRAVYEQTDRVGLNFFKTAEAAKSFFAAGQGTTLTTELDDIFKAVTNAGAALQLSTEQVNGTFIALGQMISKGKVQAEELRGQLGERLPGAFQMAAKTMGMTTAELDKFMADGKLTAEDLLPKLAKVLQEVYARSAENAANKAQGAINRMSTEWTLFKANVVDSGPMVAMINAVTDALKGQNDVASARNEQQLLENQLAGMGIGPDVEDVAYDSWGGATKTKRYSDELLNWMRNQAAAMQAEAKIADAATREQENAAARGKSALEKALAGTRGETEKTIREEWDAGIAEIKRLRKQYSSPTEGIRDEEERKKALAELDLQQTEINEKYERRLASLNKKRTSSTKSAAVAQADYTGELERTRQQIDSLQQQLGLDTTESLTKAKIKIEQRYQAEISRTNEELAKRAARGQLTPEQADTLRMEKTQAADLERQVALRDAISKAEEKYNHNLQVRADFYKELSEKTGEYNLSLEYQNQILQRQAEAWAAAGVPMRDINRMLELQRLELARDPWSGFTRGMRKWSADATNLAQQFETTMTSAFDSASDALADFVMTGKLDFADLANSIISDLARIAARQAIGGIVGGIAGSLGNLFGGGGFSLSSGQSSWVSNVIGIGAGVASAHGNVFSAPDLSAHSNTIVDEPTFFGYDRHLTAFASGAGLMGEAGPEAVMPLSRMSGGDLGVKVMWPDDMMRRVVEMDAWKANVGYSQEMMQAIAKMNEMRAERAAAMAGAPKVNVTIINQAGAEVETSQQTNSDGGIDLEIMVTKAVARDMGRRNGATNKVLRNQFGASKRPIKY